MAKHSGCPAKGKRPPSNAFLHDVCLTASPYPACGSSTGSNSVGPRKRSAAVRYTSDTVPAVVPDGGINALSGLRVLHRFKQRRPAQAQRRRAIHIRHRTRGCAGWRHKCLIRPTGPPAGSHPRPGKRSAAGRYTSDTVPAVVPDGGINALSGLRVPHRFKQRRSAQAQRRQAAGDRTEFDEESGCRKAKTRLLGGFFK
ncbi:hypothetical protein L415_04733 [Klebsiella pneumoniae UCICRE 4]|nr:hypothetical protein L415_04733 [Klebsiella pneumoniae UCICRE 4]